MARTTIISDDLWTSALGIPVLLLERWDRQLGQWVVVDAFRDPVELIDAVRAIGRREAVVLRTRHIRTQVSA